MSVLFPLLRGPNFPGGLPDVSVIAPDGPDIAIEEAEIDRVFALIRHARVGGAFWAPPANSVGHRSIHRLPASWKAHPSSLPLGQVTVDVLPLPVSANINPWSLLGPDTHLVTQGDDEWAALAVIAGGTVELTSPGIYGATNSDIRQRTANLLLRARYRDPFTGGNVTIEAMIDQLALWRRTFDANRDIVAACGISWWKRREIRRFLWAPNKQLHFMRSEKRAIAYASRVRGAIAVWPSRISSTMPRCAEIAGVPLVRIEDGFVRSVGLGSDMVPPLSVTIDRRGIHYDPSRSSDLEALLASHPWSTALLDQARALRTNIVAARISKYAGGGGHSFPERQSKRRLVLVPGQVSDDMSVRLGGGGLTDNLELLRRARALEPEAELWFRPHPDVDAGHRRGGVPDQEALTLADRVVRGGGMAELLDRIDGVHVLTSLTGFEALMRGRDVTCHGMPFYAGWGLTRDLLPCPPRRGRMLTLDQLVAAVLILYPRYLDPVTGLPCGPETLIARMSGGETVNRLGWVTRVRQMQGRLMKKRR